MGEEWRDIPGYEGRYQVSDMGRVQGPRKMLKPLKHRDGYVRVRLCFFGEETDWLIHRLVASVFIPNPLSLPEVDHGDNNKLNNAKTNLEWVTRLENMQRAERDGLIPHVGIKGSEHWNARLAEEDIPVIRCLVASGLTQQSIADLYGVSRRTIGFIKTGERWGHV